ncbi:class 1b ribonucleoside-diphosphate reductase subunit beta [Paenibacillus sp. FSL R7-0302]|uniref:class 1b ribonucleoside-diphosphate reductase subunit beta n=1 Tax=Paenibacillus sp. FSL R7-0302 TaxID=2921681 RepID=UPI0030F4D211
MKNYKAVNWNESDEMVMTFWNQNVMQFWLDTEIPLSSDKGTWGQLSKAEQEVYKRVLGGLTLLDTLQGTIGMPKIAEKVDHLQKKSVLSFMGMMENIHAKSYSSIFTTVASTQEIDEIFEWVEGNKYLQNKANLIAEYYENINDDLSLYLAMVASVFLESFLFYSGFYYPLYLAGGGHKGDAKMTASGEIINLIIRDESIHGVFVGVLAQEVFERLSAAEQEQASAEVVKLFDKLYSNEALYTDELYTNIGLQEDVKRFVRYNANKALQNLGLDTHFVDEDVNPIVINGMKTDTKTHDFFSVKGNGYVKALNVVKISDADFVFNF